MHLRRDGRWCKAPAGGAGGGSRVRTARALDKHIIGVWPLRPQIRAVQCGATRVGAAASRRRVQRPDELHSTLQWSQSPAGECCRRGEPRKEGLRARAASFRQEAAAEEARGLELQGDERDNCSMAPEINQAAEASVKTAARRRGATPARARCSVAVLQSIGGVDAGATGLRVDCHGLDQEC